MNFHKPCKIYVSVKCIILYSQGHAARVCSLCGASRLQNKKYCYIGLYIYIYFFNQFFPSDFIFSTGGVFFKFMYLLLLVLLFFYYFFLTFFIYYFLVLSASPDNSIKMCDNWQLTRILKSVGWWGPFQRVENPLRSLPFSLLYLNT